MERELFENLPSKTEKGIIVKKGRQWAQVGITRHILDITHDRYWKYRKETVQVPNHIIQQVERWRDKLSRRK